MWFLQRDQKNLARPASPERASDDEAEGELFPESRWPMAGAVISAIAITMLLPDSIRLGPVWLLPILEGLLLLALAISDPGKITRTSREVRAMSIGLVVLLALSSLISTAFLIDELIGGGSITNDASELLQAGVTVWTANGLAFALLYWELDAGGPARRARELPDYPDFAFPSSSRPGLRRRIGGRSSWTTFTSA